VNILDYEMIICVLEMRGIHLILVAADIIRESDLPSLSFESDTHQPYSREEFRERALLTQGELDHGEFLARQLAKRTLFFSYLRQQRKIGN